MVGSFLSFVVRLLTQDPAPTEEQEASEDEEVRRRCTSTNRSTGPGPPISVAHGIPSANERAPNVWQEQGMSHFDLMSSFFPAVATKLAGGRPLTTVGAFGCTLAPYALIKTSTTHQLICSI